MSTPLPRTSAPAPNPRHSPYAIEALFLQRWSPRAFHPQGIPLSDLHSILEAARWAPSAYNLQPWNFVVSRRGDDHWQTHLGLLDPFNARWACNASALLFLVSQAITPAGDGAPARPSRTHSFDAGAAWAQLALQATAMGYQAHAMAGVDYPRATAVLGIPQTHRLQVAVAIGRQAAAEQLPPALREREQPSSRRPLADLLSHGVFGSAPVPGREGAA